MISQPERQGNWDINKHWQAVRQVNYQPGLKLPCRQMVENMIVGEATASINGEGAKCSY